MPPLPLDMTYRELASTKLAKLVGPERAAGLVASVCRRASLETLDSPNDLLRFAEALGEEGGFVGAMGALLRMQAVLDGATPTRGDEQEPPTNRQP
jgi:hypothetical protein